MRGGGPRTLREPTIDMKISTDMRRTHPHDEYLGRPHVSALTITK